MQLPPHPGCLQQRWWHITWHRVSFRFPQVAFAGDTPGTCRHLQQTAVTEAGRSPLPALRRAADRSAGPEVVWGGCKWGSWVITELPFGSWHQHLAGTHAPSAGPGESIASRPSLLSASHPWETLAGEGQSAPRE